MQRRRREINFFSGGMAWRPAREVKLRACEIGGGLHDLVRLNPAIQSFGAR
jgi:hypothetical protein